MFRATKVLFSSLLLLAGHAMAKGSTEHVVKDIVIVHGAFVDGTGWRAVYDILKKDGFHVSIVQIPLTGLQDDIAATRRIVAQQEGPVVLVGHSYGGSVITDAGDDPKVRTLVYVAAFQPDAGETIGQLVSKFAPPNDAIQSTTDGYLFIKPTEFGATFAAELSPADTDFLANSQQLTSSKVFDVPTTAAAWRTKPGFAILTTEDHALSPALQRWMYQRSGAKVTELKSSHAVYATHPAAVAKVIEAAAQSSNNGPSTP